MYHTLSQASAELDVNRKRLLNTYYRDRQIGRDDRFVESDNRLVFIQGNRVGSPINEKIEKLFWEAKAAMSEKAIAKEIAKQTNKSVWSEYMNIRNFKFKRFEHAKAVSQILEKIVTRYPKLPYMDDK